MAILNDDLDGFYRSNYFNEDTQNSSWLAVTQFETTGMWPMSSLDFEPKNLETLKKICSHRKAHLKNYLTMPYKFKIARQNIWIHSYVIWTWTTCHTTTGARKSFPCMDEPAMKAKFSIKLGASEDKTAISNMPVLSIDAHPTQLGYKIYNFEPSVPMSTYLVAFLVSDFDCTSLHLNYSVCHQPSKAPQAQYAASIGPTILGMWPVPSLYN